MLYILYIVMRQPPAPCQHEPGVPKGQDLYGAANEVVVQPLIMAGCGLANDQRERKRGGNVWVWAG